jgi:hypothetical protein
LNPEAHMNHWKDAIVCASNDAYGDVRGVEVKVRGLCKDEVAPRGYGPLRVSWAWPDFLLLLRTMGL